MTFLPVVSNVEKILHMYPKIKRKIWKQSNIHKQKNEKLNYKELINPLK